jgi:hypothetical protein
MQEAPGNPGLEPPLLSMATRRVLPEFHLPR